MSAPPRLVYLVTEDWYFVSHRLPMARAARQAGYEVHVICRVGEHGAAICAEGFALHPVEWQRGSARPTALAGIVRAVRHLYRQIDPVIVHHVGLQPSVIGSVAALGLPAARLNALAGLGFVFTSQSARARLARSALTLPLRTLLRRPRSWVLVQNPDDRAAIEALGVPSSRIALIPGSGVDTDALRPLPEPPGPVAVGFLGRFLDDKGVRPLVAAHRMLRERGSDIRLVLAGTTDTANPASLPDAEVKGFAHLPGVSLPGFVTDIPGMWAQTHIAVLPSRREGLPKSLLEAAACGRAIVATDVPGCREIARQGVNALLVPPDDPPALAAAIARLAEDAELRARFATAGRRIVEAEFSSRQIGTEIVALYGKLLSSPRGGDAGAPS